MAFSHRLPSRWDGVLPDVPLDESGISFSNRQEILAYWVATVCLCCAMPPQDASDCGSCCCASGARGAGSQWFGATRGPIVRTAVVKGRKKRRHPSVISSPPSKMIFNMLYMSRICVNLNQYMAQIWLIFLGVTHKDSVTRLPAASQEHLAILRLHHQRIPVATASTAWRSGDPRAALWGRGQGFANGELMGACFNKFNQFNII